MAEYVFYEEDGGFKSGSVMSDIGTSLQVEAASGKRSKIKADKVLLEFTKPPPAEGWQRSRIRLEKGFSSSARVGCLSRPPGSAIPLAPRTS